MDTRKAAQTPPRLIDFTFISTPREASRLRSVLRGRDQRRAAKCIDACMMHTETRVSKTKAGKSPLFAGKAVFS